MASAPKSSARDTSARSLSGMRTTGVASAWLTAPIPVMTEAMSHNPCCASSTTAGNPSRAMVSATMGEPIMHQAAWTISPARRRRARAKAATSAALFDLLDGLREQFGHLRADLLLSDAFGLEVFCHLAQDVVVAGFLEVGQHDFLGIGLGVCAAFAENARRPEPKHLVAASHRLEAKLLVVCKLLFEAFFTLVECRHADPRTASVKLHVHMQ